MLIMIILVLSSFPDDTHVFAAQHSDNDTNAEDMSELVSLDARGLQPQQQTTTDVEISASTVVDEAATGTRNHPRVQQVAMSLPDYTTTNRATEEQQAREAVSFFFVSCYLFYCTHCCVSSLKILDDKRHGTRGPSAFRVAGFFSITSCPTGGHVAT
jgi:hypothetical protein